MAAHARGRFERKELHANLMGGHPVDRLVDDLPACHSALARCGPRGQRRHWVAIVIGEVLRPRHPATIYGPRLSEAGP